MLCQNGFDGDVDGSVRGDGSVHDGGSDVGLFHYQSYCCCRTAIADRTQPDAPHH